MEYSLEEIKQSIQEYKKHLKPSSIDIYYTSIRRLRQMFETNDNNFLKNPAEIDKKLSNQVPTSRRNNMIAIIAFLESINQTHQYNNIIKDYKQRVDVYNQEYAKTQTTGELTGRQVKNMVKKEEIEKLMGVLQKQTDLLKKKASFTQLNSFDKSNLRVWLLFNILTVIPTRLDYQQMKLISQSTYKKLKIKEDKGNYLLKKQNELSFVFNDYKTNKIYGENIIPIENKQLKKKINLYLKLNNYSNNDIIFPLSRNAISTLLNTKSQEIIGKRVSSQILRKYYVSEKYNNVSQEQQKDAKNMGHSVGTQQMVYNKNLKE